MLHRYKVKRWFTCEYCQETSVIILLQKSRRRLDFRTECSQNSGLLIEIIIYGNRLSLASLDGCYQHFYGISFTEGAGFVRRLWTNIDWRLIKLSGEMLAISKRPTVCLLNPTTSQSSAGPFWWRTRINSILSVPFVRSNVCFLSLGNKKDENGLDEYLDVKEAKKDLLIRYNESCGELLYSEEEV